MSFFLATPLNDEARIRTHCKGHIEQPDAGSTAPWLRLNECTMTKQSTTTMCNLSGLPLRRETWSQRQLANFQLFSLHDGRSVSIRNNEGDVKFPIAGVGEAAQPT